MSMKLTSETSVVHVALRGGFRSLTRSTIRKASKRFLCLLKKNHIAENTANEFDATTQTKLKTIFLNSKLEIQKDARRACPGRAQRISEPSHFGQAPFKENRIFFVFWQGIEMLLTHCHCTKIDKESVII